MALNRADAGYHVVAAPVRQDPPDPLLLGWRDRWVRGRYLVGRTRDPVVQLAPCAVAIVRTRAHRKSAKHVKTSRELRRHAMAYCERRDVSLACLRKEI